MILSVVLVAGFMIPIVCSCSTYVIIVAKKARWAKNAIIPAPAAGGGTSLDLESADSSNQVGDGSSRFVEVVGPGEDPERPLYTSKIEIRITLEAIGQNSLIFLSLAACIL